MNIIRNSLIVSLLVVLVLPTSFAFAAGIEDVKGVNYAYCESNDFVLTNSIGFSGDDLYDSASSLSGSDVAISIQCAEVSADIIFFSANPELSVAQFTTDVSPASAEINTFSANPELSNAQRYAEAKAKRAEFGGSLSDSPELSVAQFTTDVTPVRAEINTFSANPELSNAQRYSDVKAKRAEFGGSLSDNPELSVDVVAYDWTRYYGYGPLENLVTNDAAPVSAETKDCFADCYDNY